MTIKALKATDLCGLNIHSLYSKYVSKKEKQELSITKLYQVKAKNVTIKGTLNEIKLPDDVVLTSTDEYIPSINFNSSINLNSALNINGTIDYVSLTYLVKNRVTLRESETVLSQLIFFKDVYMKDLEVKGLINEISLMNTVKNGENTIQHLKTFKENLVVQHHMLVDTINHTSFLDLFLKICLKQEDENITSMVNFTSIETSHLKVDYINGISLDALWDEIDDAEKNLVEMEQSISDANREEKELLLELLEKMQDISPSYAFFELHQVLNLGSTAQFSPTYESGIPRDDYDLPTSKMIVWVNRNESCGLYKSLEMDVSPDGILTHSKRSLGRLFPFPLKLYDNIDRFVLHTDRQKRCTSQRRNILKTTLKEGDGNVYKLPDPSSYILQAQILELQEGIYMLIADKFEGGARMSLYHYNEHEDDWTLHDQFHPWDISSFDVIFISDIPPIEIHLAVTNAGDHPGIYHYQWDSENYLFKLKAMHPKSVSTAALWVTTGDHVFLLLAKEKTRIKKDYNWVYVYTEPIEVHILEEDIFKLMHTINIRGINSFEKFEFEGEIYVLAVSSHLQTIYVLQHRGYNGFEVIQNINAPGVVKATIFSSKKDLLLAISSSTGHSKILKCIARGNMDNYN